MEIVILFYKTFNFLDNFIPDSIDKKRGKITIAPGGEVTATFSNSNAKKVPNPSIPSKKQKQKTKTKPAMTAIRRRTVPFWSRPSCQ